MSERVIAYFKELTTQSNETLDQSAVELSRKEKQNAARLIAHIAMIGEREYYLKLGYSTLFEYCAKRLNLSEGSVYRRTQVAGVARRFPHILEAIHSGRLHLTGASLIAPLFTADNVDRLIAEASGKTKRDLDKYLRRLSPREEFKPSVRKQPASAKAPVDKPPRADPNEDGGAPTGEQGGRHDTAPVPERTCPEEYQRRQDIFEPATETRYNLRFSAGEEFTEKFKRAAEILNIPDPHNHMDEIFDLALEALLDKKDPKRKLERRRKREEKKTVKQPLPPPDAAGNRSPPKTASASRYIPSEVRERVLERAEYQCEYRGASGERCSCRTGLEVDHVVPFAINRRSDEDNLRVLCSAHNRHAAKEFFGAGVIDEKIAAAREKRRDDSALRSTTRECVKANDLGGQECD